MSPPSSVGLPRIVALWMMPAGAELMMFFNSASASPASSAAIFCGHGHNRDHEMLVGRAVPHDVGFVLLGFGGEVCGIEAAGGQDHHVRRRADPLLACGRFHGKGVGVGWVRTAGQHVADAGTVEFRIFAGHEGFIPGRPDRVEALRDRCRARPASRRGRSSRLCLRATGRTACPLRPSP